VSRGVRWRTGHFDALGGEPGSIPDALAADASPETNGLNGTGEHTAGAAKPQESEPAGTNPQPTATQADSTSALGTPAPTFAREGAVEAYCLELCGKAAARIATEEATASPRLSGSPSAVSEDELLRVTRSTASGFAPQVLHPGSIRMAIEGAQAECGFTIPRLARRANGELDRFSAAALAAHLESCVVCRAAEARHDRAERAFAAVVGVTPVIAEPPAAEVAPPAALAALPAEHDEPAPLEVEELEPLEEPEAVVEEPEAVVEEPEALEPEALEEEPEPQPMRGLVVLPAAAGTEQEPSDDARPFVSVRRSDSLGGSTMLIATLLVGAVVVVIIALLWSNASSNPDARSLPPVSTGSSAAVLGAAAHRAASTRTAGNRRLAKNATEAASATTSTAAGSSGTSDTSSSLAASGAGSSSGDSSSSSGSSSSGSSGGSSGGQPSGGSSDSGSGGDPVASQAGGGNLAPVDAPTKTIGSMFK
jgi:hypothetical protein